MARIMSGIAEMATVEHIDSFGEPDRPKGAARRTAFNVASLLTTNVVYKATTFLTYMLVARYLGAHQFGQLALAVALLFSWNKFALVGLKTLLTREVARNHAALMKDIGPGHVVLSGGELTVTLANEGRGGPNAEYALALAIALDGRPGLWAIACDTDGIDGSEGNAGALVRPDTIARARELGLCPQELLQDHDSYGFFSALDDLVMCGPTLTNVNDFRAILIGN